MKRITLTLCTLLAIVWFVPTASSQVAIISQPGTIRGSVELIANSVPDLTTVDVYTVPANFRFKITDLIVSNQNTASSCCARIFDEITARTAFITVPPGGSVDHSFLNGINFSSGQIVSVRNGASAGPLHFNVRGYLFTIP